MTKKLGPPPKKKSAIYLMRFLGIFLAVASIEHLYLVCTGLLKSPYAVIAIPLEAIASISFFVLAHRKVKNTITKEDRNAHSVAARSKVPSSISPVEDKLKNLSAWSSYGLPLAEHTHCIIYFDHADIRILGGGTTFKLLYSRILDMQVQQDVDYFRCIITYEKDEKSSYLSFLIDSPQQFLQAIDYIRPYFKKTPSIIEL